MENTRFFTLTQHAERLKRLHHSSKMDMTCSPTTKVLKTKTLSTFKAICNGSKRLMRSHPSENRMLPCGTGWVSVADSINRAVPQSPSVFSGSSAGQVVICLNELTMLSWWIRLHRAPFSRVPVKRTLLLDMHGSRFILDGHM